MLCIFISPRPPDTGRYLLLEEALILLLKLAERVKATSISGTSTTTCGRCTKPRPLWTQTCRRLSRTSRVPPSSRPTPYKRHGIQRKSPAWLGREWPEETGWAKGGVYKTPRRSGTECKRAHSKGRRRTVVTPGHKAHQVC